MGDHLGWLGSRRLTCLICLLLAAGCLRAAPANPPHARITLVSEQISIQPGSKFWVGLHFELEKHWHIYWVNPGDSGEPPRVAWNLPQGFRAGPINWPAPRRLENPPLVDYGYEDDVLLLAPLYSPRRIPARRSAELRATVKWLVCSSICIPEQQHVALRLPYKDDPPNYDPRWRKVFDHTREQLPRLMPSGWSATVLSEANQFILSVKTGTRERTATFFPFQPLQIKDAAPQKAVVGNGKIHLALQKSDQLLKPVAFLSGVLIMGDGKAITINAPVISGSGQSLRERRHRK
jgi:DsbC/DsbD-like thiol-disulfide interchange protein